jgi:hypothetical protein
MRCEPASRPRPDPGTTDPRHHHPHRRRALHDAHRGNDRRHRRRRDRGDHSSRATRGGPASRRSPPSDTWSVRRCAPSNSPHRAVRPRHRTRPQRPTRAHPKGWTSSGRARPHHCRHRTRHRTHCAHSRHHWIRLPPRRRCQVHARWSLKRHARPATERAPIRRSSAPRPHAARARTRKPRPPSSGPGFTRRTYGGDGGNRTHVRDRVRMASTSVAGALISSLTRLAGGVVGDQPPEFPRLGEGGPHRVSLLSDPGLPRRRQAGPETSLT